MRIAWLICLVSALAPLQAFAQGSCPTHSPPLPGAPSDAVYQQFPADGPRQTAWLLTYAHEAQQGFFITSAYFSKAPNDPWIKILGRSGLGEMFVPYASGQPRFLDISTVSLDLLNVGPDDLGTCGRLQDPRVIREVRDRGMIWKDHRRGRRGQELVLWGTLTAGNYSYLVEYAFRDDGSIAFRTAATGGNLPGQEAEPHIHHAMWRIDVDLNGGADNSVEVMRHVPSQSCLTAEQLLEPFNAGKEGWLDWNPHEFSSLLVTDGSLRNRRGSSVGYSLTPVRSGSSYSFEGFARHDFWVTRSKPDEIFFKEVERYADGESITNTDVVIWHMSPVLHVPRDEDGEYENGIWRGAALTMWAGFELRPRNLFAATPFYP